MRPGFLVVLLVVAAGLSFLLFPSVPFDGESAEVARARKDASLIPIALRAYLGEYGLPPAGSPAQILATLQGRNPRGLVFLEIPAGRLSSAGLWVDPWGSPYAFGSGPDQRRFWAYSFGPDKIDEGGHGDDLASWN